MILLKNKIKYLIRKFKKFIRKISIEPLVSHINFNFLYSLIKIKLKSNDYFEFKATKVKYFFHSYNNFRLTERCIEIPIIKYYLNKFDHGNVLEIGNVSKHYYDEFKDFNKKDSVDKYEAAYDVINIDIRKFTKDNKYNFIYSISTFEHMDSDGGRNPDFNPTKNDTFSSIAFETINRTIDLLLCKGGKFILTFPLGYCNCEIDRSLYNKEYIKFNVKNINTYFFKKINELTWKQINVEVNQLAKENLNWASVKYLCVMEITR